MQQQVAVDRYAWVLVLAHTFPGWVALGKSCSLPQSQPLIRQVGAACQAHRIFTTMKHETKTQIIQSDPVAGGGGPKMVTVGPLLPLFKAEGAAVLFWGLSLGWSPPLPPWQHSRLLLYPGLRGW